MKEVRVDCKVAFLFSISTGFSVSISCYFQKPKYPKISKKLPSLPEPPRYKNLQVISTPFFPAVTYPLCHFRHYVQSLHYPYVIFEDHESVKSNEFLRQAFYYLSELKDDVLESELISEEELQESGLKIPEGMAHESGQWPLPKVESLAVNDDGSATFTNITFPNADRPGEPYEPFEIENYAKSLEKSKKKYGVYFGERPPDQKLDALGNHFLSELTHFYNRSCYTYRTVSWTKLYWGT